jgi:DNA-binding MarR family transcriptional regulator
MKETREGNRLLAAVERIAAARRALLQDIATRHGLSPLQVEVIRMLANDPPPEHRSTDLASELSVSTATVTDALQALRRKELVRDKPDPDDARRKILALTTKGRTVARTIARELEPFTTAATNLDNAAQLNAVVALLDVIGQLRAAGVVTIDRSCATCAHRRTAGGPHGSCSLLGVVLTPLTLRVRCAEHEPLA